MQKRWISSAAVSGVVLISTVAGGLSAQAEGTLSAWDRTNFSGTLIGEGIGEVVDVPDDRTQSTINDSVFAYSARNVVNALFSEEIKYFPSGTQLQDYGSQNNTVDHFDRAS